MLSFSTVLLVSAVLFSAIMSFGNANALPVSATRNEIRLSYESAMDPLTNYTDNDVISNPTVFNNVTESEFLQALSLEGIDSSEDVVESHSDAKYEERLIPAPCIKNIDYMYYNCSDPEKREESFSEYKGPGYCPLRGMHRGRLSARHRTPLKHHRVNSFHRRGRSNFQSAVRFQSKENRLTFIGYKFIRKHTQYMCRKSPTYGHFLRQIVSEFVLKGKKQKYQKVINRAFKRIRRRYRGFQYVIQSETYERNGKVYVRFFFNEKHTGEAEH